DGFRRLDELGLLEPLGGSLTSIERAGAAGYPDYDLVVVFGENLLKLPISNETRRFARTLLRAEPPAIDSPRAIHRFRRATEPWALEALAFLGARGFDDAVIRAREADPKKPLVRGGELELPPGPRRRRTSPSSRAISRSSISRARPSTWRERSERCTTSRGRSW